MNKKLATILILLGILGSVTYLVERNSVALGLCSDVQNLQSGIKICNSTIGWGDYFKPLWDFSRAILVVGVLLLFVRNNKTIFIFSLLSLVGIALAVLMAPSTSSDFLFPSEKKSIGTFLSGAYLVISLAMIGIQFFRQRSAP